MVGFEPSREPRRVLPPSLIPPKSVEELDISIDLVFDLFLRRTLIKERQSTSGLAADVGLHPAIIAAVFEELRGRRWLDVLGLNGFDYSFTLTSEGRAHASRSMERCNYAALAPVSLRRYWEVCSSQRAFSRVTPTNLKQAFYDLVITQDVLDLLGPAFNAQQAIFLYGPPGTGKTSIAERLGRLYGDAVAIPQAVEVDGQVITVFDPAIHRPVDVQPDGLDPRWVVCQRPMVVVGGELEPSMLELKLDPRTGTYGAPLQMRANNGILLIDDLGRQVMSPAALLNRWIVPLERRVDYLTLGHGMKFAIPFLPLVLFSTNFEPSKLGDEAFFRRIQTKVYIGPVADPEFDAILDRAAAANGVAVPYGAHEAVRAMCQEYGKKSLRPCYPWDICRLVRVISDYEQAPPVLDAKSVHRAGELYFTSAMVPVEGDEGDHSDVTYALGRYGSLMRQEPDLRVQEPARESVIDPRYARFTVARPA